MLAVIAVVVVALLAGAALYLYTPDKDRAALEAQYAQPPSIFVEALGDRIHVRDTGPRDAPTLVLLHGFAASLQTWDAWAAALQDRFRVIRLDLPGFGLTGPDVTGDYSNERSIAVIAALMDRLGVPRATIIGNSMGGNIAWRFAAALPARTDKLVLVSPAGFRPPGETGTAPTRLPLMIRMMRYVLPAPILRMNLAAAYNDPASLTPALVARTRDMLLVPGNRDAILARMLQTTWPDPLPFLHGIQAPTLLIWGEQDRLIPYANSADYMAALPHATLAALPGQGHVPQEEASAASLVPLLAFLAKGS